MTAQFSDIREHFSKPLDFGIVLGVLDFISFYHKFCQKFKSEPDISDCTSYFGDDNNDPIGASIYDIINDIKEFFKSKAPQGMQREIFAALKYRWGFIDNEIHKLNEVSDEYNIRLDSLVNEERKFILRLGWKIKDNKETVKK